MNELRFKSIPILSELFFVSECMSSITSQDFKLEEHNLVVYVVLMWFLDKRAEMYIEYVVESSLVKGHGY